MPGAVVNGVRLFYEERGEGAPILCIHGAGSSALLWEDAVEKLARLGRVIAYDRRGHSRSERPEPYERTSVAEQADDAAVLLDDLAATPAVVIGRSYGGTVGIDLALRYPDRVRALVVLEGDAVGLSPTGAAWVEAIAARVHEAAAQSGVEAVGKALAGEVFGDDVWDSLPEELRRTLTENGAAILAELPYEEGQPDAAAFATIGTPTLVVVADESPPEQRELTEAIADALPNARLARVGGGHLIDPAAPEVLAFVEEVLGTR